MKTGTTKKTRGNYKVTAETRRRLLEAAGELFACHGTDAVTVRDITARAGTKPNAVSYHFGGKEGLVNAVWDFCLLRWNEDRMGRYCAKNDHLFKTRDGKRQLVTDLVNIFYETLYDETQPLWANLFLLRILITAQDTTRTRAIDRLIFEILSQVYRRITGNDDPLTARCWALTIVCPGSFPAASATDLLHFEQIKEIDYVFFRRLQGLVTQSALYLAGLADDQTSTVSKGNV